MPYLRWIHRLLRAGRMGILRKEVEPAAGCRCSRVFPCSGWDDLMCARQQLAASAAQLRHSFATARVSLSDDTRTATAHVQMLRLPSSSTRPLLCAGAHHRQTRSEWRDAARAGSRTRWQQGRRASWCAPSAPLPTPATTCGPTMSSCALMASRLPPTERCPSGSNPPLVTLLAGMLLFDAHHSATKVVLQRSVSAPSIISEFNTVRCQ